jgi:hypothetical protein
MMSNYAFTMEVSGFNTAQNRFEDALFNSGCDDALIVVNGDKILLDFDREASSFETAISTARHDVERAGGRVGKIERSAE